MARANSREIVGAHAYATVADFEQIFTDEMSGLYMLSFLLAADPDKAEECFKAGFGESTKEKRVFKEWVRSWARRSVLQSAIRLMVPRQHSESTRRNRAVARAIDKLPLVLQAEVSAIIELAPLERFVFVMSVLERYSDHDCSILLGCERRDVSVARARALQQLGRLMGFQKNDAGTPEYSAVHEDPRPVIELTIARYFATQAWNSNLSHDAPLWP
jgi:DNA-directed RNA polymerase specialized sigma24 family protein